jgi:outer membrane lipoprotein-sorting protein
MGQTSTAQAPAAPKVAEEQFKNIQVLKGVPADQVVPAMQFVAASLGVECDYCHVRGDHGLAPDKDDKKQKVTARKMMQMMLAINKDSFEGRREVTCYSCHRGAAQPVATPIIADESANTGAAEEKKPGDAKPVLPAAEELLDKYLAAVGGADASQKITSRVEKGTFSTATQKGAIEIYAKAPDKRVSIVHTPNGDSVTAFDGHAGWLGFSGRAHMMSGADNDAAHMDADLSLAAHLKTLYKKFTTAPGEKIDGQDTYLVVGRNEGQPPLRLYLDQQSGLLLRVVRYAETPLGRNPTQIDYADYRAADGVKIPFRWTVARPGNRFTIQVDQVQQNVPVPDDKFVAPPQPPAPGQKPAGD